MGARVALRRELDELAADLAQKARSLRVFGHPRWRRVSLPLRWELQSARTLFALLRAGQERGWWSWGVRSDGKGIYVEVDDRLFVRPVE